MAKAKKITKVQEQKILDDCHEDELSQILRDFRMVEAQNLGLYADVSRKLQLYSASIKAAVSSLLNHDFFWDSANQHEFLESINASVSQVSDMTVLLTLAFRAEAGTLEMERDPQHLQEILSVSLANARLRFPNLKIIASYPPQGKMVRVDYEYLTKAFLLIFEVLNASRGQKSLEIVASESGQVWNVVFSGLDIVYLNVLKQQNHLTGKPLELSSLSVENTLRLKVASEILQEQEIEIDIIDVEKDDPKLLLKIKSVKTPKVPVGD